MNKNIKRLADLTREIKEMLEEYNYEAIYINVRGGTPRIGIHKYLKKEYDMSKPYKDKWNSINLDIDDIDVEYSTFYFQNTEEGGAAND